MAGRTFAAEIVAVDALTGERSLVTLSCPPGSNIAAQVKPGQFVQVRCRDRWSYDPFLPHSFFVFAASVSESTMAITVDLSQRGHRWLANRRPGDQIDVSYPTGNGFTIGGSTRNLLLVARSNERDSLVMLAADAVRRGVNVTLLMGSRSESDLLPPGLLPMGVEFVVATRDGSRGYAGDVTDLIPDYARWADQIFSQGDAAWYRPLKTLLQPHRLTGKPSLQVAVDGELPCGVGVCHGCAIPTKHGNVLACVRGPVFDADELV